MPQRQLYRSCKRINKAFRSVRKAAGLGSEVTPHTLRHTAITWQAQLGVPPHEICGFFGITIEVFERVYGHHHPDYQSNAVKNKQIERYVFIDDLCGSGVQAAEYSENIVRPLKRLNPRAKVYYYTLFATSFGLSEVKKLGRFDDVATVVELDESFKCFSTDSRIYRSAEAPFSKGKAKDICWTYGVNLAPGFPLGWRDGQLLIGFCHNTPDNTLPVIWYDEPTKPWTPLFRRYPKEYGWEA